MEFKNNKVAKSLIVLALAGFTSTASAEWKYGVGTGLSGLAIKGDMSLGTKTPLGTVVLPLDFSPSDIREYTDSAFGFGGYATDGKFLIKYGYGNLNLEDTLTADNFGSKIEFSLSEVYVNVAYPIYKAGNLKLSVIGGVSYLEHDLSVKMFNINDTDLSYKVSNDNSWIDAELGLSADVKLAPKWTWSSSLVAGAGQSDGTLTVATGVSWQISKSWSTSLAYSYADVEYTANDKDDTDYYNYDMDESVISLSFLYHF